MARRSRFSYRGYSRKRKRRKARKRSPNMKVKDKGRLEGAGIATAILIFMPAVYLKIAEALGRGGQ